MADSVAEEGDKDECVECVFMCVHASACSWLMNEAKQNHSC